MNTEVIHILLIEDDPGDACLIAEDLRETNPGTFQVSAVESLGDALAFLEAHKIDAILLDLNLPDGSGLATLVSLRAQHSTVPIVVLSGMADEVTAVDAANAGAHDFIIKKRSDPGNMLMRAIVDAIERSRMIDKLQRLAITDELTQLYNRRGFETLAHQHLRLARRNRQDFALFFTDIDGLKSINDSYGHAAGDQAIKQTAEILRTNFRDSDITERMGGDEFVVLATDYSEAGASILAARVQEILADSSPAAQHKFKLGISMGMKCFNSENESPMSELLDRADAALYRMKQERKRAP